jgi:NAD(P)-dependent dehydrogenase (short-subunit alcohol dehydrogenase family)
VTDRDALEGIVTAAAERFGRIDILVNAAQAPEMRSALIAEITDAVVDELWRSGAVATLALMRAVRPHMIASGGGSIINFGSSTIHTSALRRLCRRKGGDPEHQSGGGSGMGAGQDPREYRGADVGLACPAALDFAQQRGARSWSLS